MTTPISSVLKNASASQDADSAAVFANVLNSDQHAMKTLKGNTTYSPDDAARVARIMAEYAGLQNEGLRQAGAGFGRPIKADAVTANA
ncbi:hypothetical protein KXR64_14215 [Brucella intermedia]|uniref:hypothetical protein n=1 Tax=Brucella TaxID=234 RepID=UPI0009466047|nr:hypothetical protein [Brucella intermedia]